MRKLFLAGLVGMLAFAVANCGNARGDDSGPEPASLDYAEQEAVPKVDIVILPLPPNSVVVDGEEYTEPGAARRDFPDEGIFEIEVDTEVYELDAFSPDSARLEKVYVVVGSKYVIGVYKHTDVRVAATIGDCVTCPNGATKCGYNPRCPRTPAGSSGRE